jgi:soluble lytic murein transglycosylase-like protein
VSRRAAKLAAVALTAAMLAACSGQLPHLADADSAAQGQKAIATQPSAKPKRVRATTPKDILAEWGTFGLAYKPYRTARAARVVPIAEPEITLTIQDIMDDATCKACDQKPYHRIVQQASNQHGVPAGLIHAVIQKESGYNPTATSHKRARGLMQVTPATGRFVGVANSKRLYDPHTNIHAGTAYLKYLMQNHDTVDEVLAAYNAGPGNVRKYNGVPPFTETRRYVSDVKRFYSATAQD